MDISTDTLDEVLRKRLGALGARCQVSVIIRVDTTGPIASREPTLQEERRIMDEYPTTLFDFHFHREDETAVKA